MTQTRHDPSAGLSSGSDGCTGPRARQRAERDDDLARRRCDVRLAPMPSPARHHRYTYGEYVALEEHANVRHEFFDGEIYAMAGGTPEHAAICTNVSTALNIQLRGRGCRVHSSDLLIRVLETGLATYPDVTVVCERAELDPANRNAITNPTVLVEVLSPG